MSRSWGLAPRWPGPRSLVAPLEMHLVQCRFLAAADAALSALPPLFLTLGRMALPLRLLFLPRRLPLLPSAEGCMLRGAHCRLVLQQRSVRLIKLAVRWDLMAAGLPQPCYSRPCMRSPWG